jgi:excinuclease ABC subunit C
MMQSAEEMRFEMAAKYRDLRKTVLAIAEQQKMATSPDRDVDIFGYYREGARLALQLSRCAKARSSDAASFLGRFAGG